jgi:hypothetical protein
MALGSIQPLTEMSTRNLKKKPGGKGRPALFFIVKKITYKKKGLGNAHPADNLAAIC